MNNTNLQNQNAVEMDPINMVRSEQRVIYGGDSVYNRQVATQVIDVNQQRPPDTHRNMTPQNNVNNNLVDPESHRTNNSTVSGTTYDPEDNSLIHREGSNIASRWFARTASRFSNGFDLTHNLNNQNRNNNIDRMLFAMQYQIMKESQSNSSKFKRKIRRLFVVMFFLIVVGLSYFFSVRFLDYLDKRVVKGFNRFQNNVGGPEKNAVNIQELNKVIDELRIEIQKLKEVSYKNSLAISGLSNGVYKVPGSEEETETIKRNKFGKTGNTVNLNGNVHRQDIKSTKRREENTDFVQGTIEYDANITLQS